MKKLLKASLAAAACAAVIGCTTAPQDGAFRMMSYNIRHGAGMDERLDFLRTARVIAAESPRFVGLQEVDQLTSRVKGADTCAILAKETGLHATFARAISFGGGEYGNAVLSREEPLSVRRVPLPGGEKRVLLLCEFDDCWFGTMHLAVDSERARLQSIALIRQAVADCGDKPVFLSGDWNAKPESSVIRELKGFLCVLTGTETTYHPDPQCIDYIAVDTAHAGAYEVASRRVIPDRMTSDHMPSVVDVVRREGEGGRR